MKCVTSLFIVFSSYACAMQQPQQSLSLAAMPADVQSSILLQISDESLVSTAYALRSILFSCKSFARFANDPVTTKQLIAHLMPIALKNPSLYRNKEDFASIESAIALSTVGAREWFKNFFINSAGARMACDRLFGVYMDSCSMASPTRVRKLGMLLDAGIPINWIDTIGGSTILIKAVYRADDTLVAFLLSRKIDTTVEDFWGETAKEAVKRFLKKAFAKKDKEKIARYKNIKRMLKSHKG